MDNVLIGIGAGRAEMARIGHSLGQLREDLVQGMGTVEHRLDRVEEAMANLSLSIMHLTVLVGSLKGDFEGATIRIEEGMVGLRNGTKPNDSKGPFGSLHEIVSLVMLGLSVFQAVTAVYAAIAARRWVMAQVAVVQGLFDLLPRWLVARPVGERVEAEGNDGMGGVTWAWLRSLIGYGTRAQGAPEGILME